MIHGDRPRTHKQPKKQERGGLFKTAIYLTGTLGVALALTIAVIVADRSGWLDDAQDALQRLSLKDLPSMSMSTSTSMSPDVFPGLVNNVRGVGQTTTTLLQRGNDGVRQGQNPGK